MVASPHGREGGQVMADLLTRLDVAAWDVRPEHKRSLLRYISTHFPALGPADSPRIADHSVLCFDVSYALLTSEQIAEAAFTGRKITASDLSAKQEQHLKHCVFSRTQGTG